MSGDTDDKEVTMAATAHFSLSEPFVLRDDHVVGLWKLLAENIGSVKAKLYCSDAIVRSITEIERLVEYENPVSRRVRQVQLSAHSGDAVKRATVTISAGEIGASITSSEDEATLVRLAIQDIFVGTRPWYSRAAIAHERLAFVLTTIVMITLGAMLGGVYTRFFGGALDIVFGFTSMIITLWLALLLLLVPFVGRLLRRIFPFDTFAIGQGKQRYEDLEKLRWNVILGFVVSLVASLVVVILISAL